MRPRLSREELLHLRWLLGGAVALLAVSTVFYLESAMWPIGLAGCAAIVVALALPRLVARVPGGVYRFGVPVIALVFAADLHLNEMIPAFVRLSLLLVVHRAVSFRTAREDMQLALLCLFLIVVTGVLTVSVVFAVQIALFAALAMVFLFLIHVVRDETGGAGPREAARLPVSRPRLFLRVLGTMDLRFAALGGGLAVAVALIATVIFVMIPRFEVNTPFQLFGLKKSGSVTGFSERIALGEVTKIAQDNGVAMRVDVAGIPTEGVIPYWRMVALDDYLAGGFGVSRAVEARVGARAILTADLVPEWARAGESAPRGRFTIFMEPGVSRFVPTPGAFERVQFKELQPVVADAVLQTLSLSRASASLLSFRIDGGSFDGRLPDPGFGTVRFRAPGASAIEASATSAALRRRFLPYPETTLAVPVSEAERDFLREQVKRITRGETLDAETFARRACAHLGERHRYSMSVSLPEADGEQDPVVRWMRAGLAGHCEFFAASFVLLSRTAGFPTRAVTGFKGGTWNGFENYYMVRNSDAHAWCEIFDGRGGWIRVDPTPGAGGSGDVSLEAALGTIASDDSLAAYLDSLRMLWYRRIVSFDRRAQREFVGSARSFAADVAGGAARAARRGVEEFRAWMHRPLSATSRGDGVLAIVVVALVALGVRRTGFRFSDVLEHFSRADAPTRRRAGRLLLRLQGRLADPPRRRGWDEGAARGIEHDLIAIRYGRRSSWPDPLSVFRAARRLL